MDENGELTIPILRTKIVPPRPHPETTPRAGLEERLRNAFSRKLVLVSAPAGYGKTTLLARALLEAPLPVAWLSLDERDNQSLRFWSYLISALQVIFPGVGTSALAMLRAPQTPPFDAILVDLLNDLSSREQEFILVVDDLHDISLPEIIESLAELIGKMPDNMHLVLSSRQIPELPLARLRARRDLVELNVADLRFQSPEVERLFNQLFELDLSRDDLNTLENLTEGWIAGLQLAALVLRSPESEKTTIAHLVESFHGGHQYVFDYLAQEVLNRQEPELRRFIVQTGSFPRLCAPLCDEVFQINASQIMLERIAAANLFLTPLDAERHWYRYHNLFSSCLSRILHAEHSPAFIEEITRRAASWYADQGLIHEAADMAESIAAHDLLAKFVERYAESLFDHSELVSLTRWLHPLPLTSYEYNPRLGMIYAWASLATASDTNVDPVLQAVERGLGCAADGSPESFQQPAQVQAALAEISCMRSSLAFNHFDLASVLEISKRARAYLSGHSKESLFNKRIDLLAVAFFNEGLVLAFSGQVNSAIEALEESVQRCEQAQNIHLLPMAYAHLSNVYLVQGRLCLAEQTLRKAIPSPVAGLHSSPMAGVALTRLGLIAYERNQLEAAREYLETGLDQGRRWNSWESALLGHVGLARYYQAQGDLLKAIAEIDALEKAEIQQPTGPVAQTAALYRAEIALRQGDLAKAQNWLDESGLKIDTPITYYNEEAMLLQAKTLVASHYDQDAMYLTERIYKELEDQGRMGRVLEILLLQAVLYERQGDSLSMNQVLGRALEFAETEGYRRSLIDLGANFLLIARDYSGPHQDYLRQLVEIIASSLPATEDIIGRAHKLHTAGLLSQREIEVLRLVAEGKTNQEISEQLFISLNTVKTHVRHIFQSLEARNRAEAIARARENQLL